jgi:hypothetical protein
MERVKIEQRLFLGGSAFFFDISFFLLLFLAALDKIRQNKLRRKHFPDVSETETNLSFAGKRACSSDS